MNSTNENNKLKIVLAAIMLPVILLDLAALAYVAFLSKGILFLIYCVLYVVLPGAVLCYIFGIADRIGSINRYLRAVLVFYLGILQLFIQYYLLKSVGHVSWIRYSVPIIIILIALFMLKYDKNRLILCRARYRNLKSDFRRFINGEECWFVAVLITSVTFLVLVFSLFQYPSQEYFTYQDNIWHMSNINILASGSFSDYRVFGYTFRYHYFSDLFYAICKIIFKVETYDCIVKYQVFVIPSLVVLSVYGFFRHLLPEGKTTILKLTTLVLLFAPATLPVFTNSFNYQWLSNVNAVGLTLPCMLILLVLIKLSIDYDINTGKSGYIKLLLLLAVFQLLVSGFKGPIAVTVVGGFAVYALLALRFQNTFKRNITIFAAILAPFLLVYYMLLSYGLASGTAVLSVSSWFSPATEGFIFETAYEDVLKFTGSSLFAKLLLLIPHYLCATGPAAICSVFAIILCIYRYISNKNMDKYQLFSCCFLITGAGGYYLVNHSGKSQMYFLFAVLPTITYIAGQWLSEYNPVWRLKTGYQSLIIFFSKLMLQCVLIIILFISLFSTMILYGSILKKDIDNWNSKYEETDVSNVFSVSSEEIEGLRWIRDNTDMNVMCATNKHYILSGDEKEKAWWFFDSAYSERQLFIEGYSYETNSGFDISKGETMIEINDRMFSGEYNDQYKYELAEKLGIEYLIIHMNEDLSFIPSGKQFSICFKNDSIAIISIRRL